METSYLLVEFEKVPSQHQINEILALPSVAGVKRFDSYTSEYFSKLYEVQLVDSSRSQSVEALLLKSPLNLKVTRPSFATLSTLFPSSETKEISNDTYVNYQWSLKNKGYIVEQELTDLKKIKTYSLPGADIGWSSAYVQDVLKNKLKKDVIVAVLDSGIDHSHPDINANIYRNLKECDDGEISLDPKDRDGNGLEGDCMGWDFTGTNPKQAHRPLDKIGHGTHVAGIISAINDNREGISGLSNHLKILPIKVTFEGDGPTNRKGTTLAIVDRMAKGILYAIKMKAQVVNFSLGWPKAADQTIVREAIKEALKNNITIVAAAGNNNHNAPIFPCSYEGVLCVGSVDVDGKVSDFSNFGPQVDVLAPGDHILSLIPKAVDSDYWNIESGYDRKSGTSQAAPYISAMAGILKGLEPSLTYQQVYARFMQSAQGSRKLINYTNKSSLAAIPSLEALVKKPLSQEFILPSFKDLYYLPVNAKTLKTSLEIPFTNYGSRSTGKVLVSLKTNNKNVKIEPRSITLDPLIPYKTKNINITLTAKNEYVDSHLELEMKVLSSGKSETYRKTLELLSDIDRDSRVISLPITQLTKDPRWDLSTLPAHLSSSPYPEYYFKKVEKGTLSLRIYRKDGKQIKELPELKFENHVNLLSLERLDLNGDGSDDYYIRTVEVENDEKRIHHFFLNAQLQPLYGEGLSDWILDFDSVILNPGDYRWITLSSELFGHIRVPLFQADGLIPEWDRNPDEFDFEPNYQLNRTYYFEPFRGTDGKIHLRTRNFDNQVLRDKIEKSLGLSYLDNLRFSHLMPQSKNRYDRNEVEVLIEYGSKVPYSYSIIKLRTLDEVHKKSTKNSHNFKIDIQPLENKMAQLGELRLKPSINLNQNTFDIASGVLFPFIESHQTAHLFWGRNEQIDFHSSFTTNSIDNHVQQVLQGYEVLGHRVTYLLTKDLLYVLDDYKGSQKASSTPLVRSTFLRGHLFQESLFPISYKQNRQLWPAIYMDATRLTGSKISIWTYDGSEAKTPLRFNVTVPESCDPLNPVVWEGSHAFVLLCTNKDSKVMKVLPLVD